MTALPSVPNSPPKWIRCSRCGQLMLEENATYLGHPPAPYGALCAEIVLSRAGARFPSPVSATRPLKRPLWE